MHDKKVHHKQKILGKGWQYTTYDIGSGRVYKKFNSRWEAFWPIMKERWFVFWMIPFFMQEMRVNAERSLQFLEHFLSVHPQYHVLFGNVQRVGDGTSNLDFEQDQVMTMEAYFASCSPEDARLAVDKFVALCEHLFVQYGFIDKTFKMARNFGVDKHGEIVFLDVGEILFLPDAVKKRIQKRVWANFGEMIHVPKYLRKYYIEKMDHAFYKVVNH